MWAFSKFIIYVIWYCGVSLFTAKIAWCTKAMGGKGTHILVVKKKKKKEKRGDDLSVYRNGGVILIIIIGRMARIVCIQNIYLHLASLPSAELFHLQICSIVCLRDSSVVF